MKFINYILKFFSLELNYIEYDTDKNYDIDINIDRELAIHIYNKEVSLDLHDDETDITITAMTNAISYYPNQSDVTNNLKQIENRLNEYL